MSNVIDLEGVKRGKSQIRRAVELGRERGNRAARSVPVTEIVATVTPQTLTVEELAGMVRLAAITIRRDIRAGKLKAANGGGKSAYRISRSDAESWWRARGGGVLQEDSVATMPQAHGDIGAFLNLVQGFRAQLESDAQSRGTTFEGVNGADLVNAGRESRSMREDEK